MAIINQILDLLKSLISALLALLPHSPFRPYIIAFTPPDYLGWLNWFFPVADCIAIFTAWLGVMALFFLYRIIMKWVKLL